MNKKTTVVIEAWKTLSGSTILAYLSYLFLAGISVTNATTLGRFVDSVIHGDLDYAQSQLVHLIVQMLISIIGIPLIDWWCNVAAFHKSLDYDCLVLHRFFKKKYDKMQQYTAGQAATRLAEDPYYFLYSTVLTPTRCIAYSTIVVIICILMLQTNAYIASVLLLFAIAGLLQTFGYANQLGEYAEQQRLYNENVHTNQTDMIYGKSIFIPRLVNDAFINHMRIMSDRHLKICAMPEITLRHRLTVLREFILLVGVGVLLTWGVTLTRKDSLSIGQVITLYYYFIHIRTLISQIVDYIKGFCQLPDLIQRMEELTGDSDNNVGMSVPANWKVIEATGVCFSYELGKPVLDNFSFKIARGKISYIRGENGSGKSTFLKLLSGLYSAQRGTITLDGIPLEQYSMVDWRSKVSVMEQFPAIFPGTVRENIRIADLTAEATRLDEVLNMVGLHEISERVLLGQPGELSGGEIRRIAIARVLLKNAPIIFLDEPYEHLDEKGSRLVQQLLNKEGTTRVCIVHDHK